jgi:hypothetical protein
MHRPNGWLAFFCVQVEAVIVNDALTEEKRAIMEKILKEDTKKKGTKAKRTRAKKLHNSPVSAFVTFEDADGVANALHNDLQVFGLHIDDEQNKDKRICHIQPAANFKSLFISNLPYTADGQEMVNMLQFLLPPDFPVSCRFGNSFVCSTTSPFAICVKVMFEQITPGDVCVRNGVFFIEFPSQEMASTAMAALKDADWAGRRLRADWSTSKYVKRFTKRTE